MYPSICPLFLVFSVFVVVVVPAEKGSKCVTPNGENALCVSINDCPPIKQAITYLDEDTIEFARKSQCGYDDSPLVCCGSAGRITTPYPPTKPPPIIDVHVPATAAPIKHLYLPDNTLCGLQSKQNKAPGGNVTEIHEYPWLVALKYTKHDGTPGGFRCSGTLINQRYILTAAQCLYIPGFNLTHVRLGEWDFSSEEDCYIGHRNEEHCVKPIDLPIIDRVSHPYYSNKSGNNDIALVRVEGKIKYNEFIRPICLPPSDFPSPPAGSLMEATGWTIEEDGSPCDIKLKANYSMVGHEECDLVFPNYTQRYVNKACIRDDGFRDQCVGDSGRPLLRNYIKDDPTDERQWYQEGILYKGLGCGEKRAPGLYTKVSRYINWILSNVKKP